MNPKVEVVKLNIAKKGQQVGTFTARCSFEGGIEVILPGMRIVEGPKKTFVDVPSRKFKDVGFIPHYYVNKTLKDLITDLALDQYERVIAEGSSESSQPPEGSGTRSFRTPSPADF